MLVGVAAVDEAKVEEEERVVTTMEVEVAALAALRRRVRRSAELAARSCRRKIAYLAEEAAATDALLMEA